MTVTIGVGRWCRVLLLGKGHCGSISVLLRECVSVLLREGVSILLSVNSSVSHQFIQNIKIVGRIRCRLENGFLSRNMMVEILLT